MYTRPTKFSDDLYPYPHTLRYVPQTPIDAVECLAGLDASLGAHHARLDVARHGCTRVIMQGNTLPGHNFSEADVYGPTFGDIGGPLLCAGEQFAVAAFGVFHEDKNGIGKSVHMMTWTLLNVHLPWIHSNIAKDGKNRRTEKRSSR